MPTKPYRKEKFPVYLTTQERAIVRVLARSAELSISEWIRMAVLQHPDFIATRGSFKTGQPLFGDDSDLTTLEIQTVRPVGRPPTNGHKKPMFGDDEED